MSDILSAFGLGGSSIDTPGNRRLGQELAKIHHAQVRFAPEDYAMEAKYGPLYNRLDLNKAQENLMGYTDDQGVYRPGTAALTRAGQQIQRTGDVADVLALGPATSEALLAANPYLRPALDQLSGRLQDPQVLQQLNQQANEALALKGQLSPEAEREAVQSARTAYSARGMVQGEPAAAAEILSRDAAVRQRQTAAQQLAGQVQQLNQGQNAFVNAATGTISHVMSDPFMAILGRPSNVSTSAALPGATPYAPGNYLNYASDLFNTNYNAAFNLGIANANNQAAQQAALASIAGKALSSGYGFG